MAVELSLRASSQGSSLQRGFLAESTVSNGKQPPNVIAKSYLSLPPHSGNLTFNSGKLQPFDLLSEWAGLASKQKLPFQGDVLSQVC